MAHDLGRERAEFEQFELVGSTITDNEFGRGSYAVVLELKHRGLKCAGKKLYRVLYEAGIGHAARRYLEECRLLSKTRHPHIVQFLGVCFEEGSQFPILVMEFLPTNLTSCLERYGILPKEISFSILHDVSLGLVYLHCQTPAVIHRDLSANNILLSTNMTAKISDLGVARIVNLTPQQRMTETPGTQAYMPPEVMVADPQYGVSVDEFSFGALMVHVFTAEWPAPKISPNRIDPANPQKVIAVTEFERREYLIRKIGDHPLLNLIRMCLSNNPDFRPHAPEILGRLRDIVLQHPPSFENRVEMLRRISEDDAQKSDLQQEVEKISIEAQASTEENVRRICTIQEEVSNLKAELLSTTLAYSVEIEQVKLQAANQEGITSLREAENSSLTSTLKDTKEEAEVLQQQVSAQKATLSIQETELFEKTAAYERKNAECESLHPILRYTRDALDKKEAIIMGLNRQLSRTRDYLTSTSSPQCVQASLSFSRCAKHAPTAMIGGRAIVIADTLYYSGGEFTSDHHIASAMKVHRYNLHNEEWQTPTQNTYCAFFSLGCINGTLVSIGGIRCALVYKHVVGDMYKQIVHRSGESIFVDTETPMPTPRRTPTVISHPSCLIVAGGVISTTNFTCTDAVEVYNTKTNSWSPVDKLPINCWLITGGIHSNGNVYLMGGRNEEERLNRAFITSLENLMSEKSTDTNTATESIWSEIPNTPVYWPSVLIASNIILAIGGTTSQDFSNKQRVKTVYAYSISLGSWIHISDLPTTIAAACIASISPAEFLVISGAQNGTDECTATVYKGTFNMSL